MWYMEAWEMMGMVGMVGVNVAVTTVPGTHAVMFLLDRATSTVGGELEKEVLLAFFVCTFFGAGYHCGVWQEAGEPTKRRRQVRRSETWADGWRTH